VEPVFNLFPGSGDKKAFVHVRHHTLELLHWHGECQSARIDSRPGGNVEHAQYGARAIRFAFDQRILNDCAASGAHRTKNRFVCRLVVIGKRKQAGKDIRRSKENDDLRLVRLL
jgi:hypothetical protein